MSSQRIIYKLTVEKIVDHTPSIKELFLKTQEASEFQFRAGQFVSLHVPQTEKPVLRAYSIASSALSKNGFRLIFKYVPEGKASTYVWALQQGESVQITGPFGRVFFKEPPTEQVIFLNTGSGVSQHYCYLETFLEQYRDRRYRLLFGVRNESEIYYQNELEILKSQLPDFQYEFVLSQPSASWTGKKGYVQNFIDGFDYNQKQSTFYLCGNGGMIKEVKAKLAGENFDKNYVLAESFD